MGEATPAQSAAGAFAPMLGVGLGTMPAGVGNGPVGATSRGSAVPQLHSAIVERLRARIELCRRHHSTCENRYQRGQAESSDREHDSTLHLLNIVHQGPGNRKTKGGRGSNQQPPEYSRANGEPKGAEGEQKISTRIAVSFGETQFDDCGVNECVSFTANNCDDDDEEAGGYLWQTVTGQLVITLTQILVYISICRSAESSIDKMSRLCTNDPKKGPSDLTGQRNGHQRAMSSRLLVLLTQRQGLEADGMVRDHERGLARPSVQRKSFRDNGDVSHLTATVSASLCSRPQERDADAAF